MTSDQENDRFESLLIQKLKENLNPSKNVYRYANVTLDKLFVNDGYESDGTKYYFEIPAKDTWHKCPVIVKL